MAIYEYECRKCGRRFEAMQPMRAEPLEVCGEECVAEPKDGTGKVFRLLSVANVGTSSSSSAREVPAMPQCQHCDRFNPGVCGR